MTGSSADLLVGQETPDETRGRRRSVRRAPAGLAFLALLVGALSLTPVAYLVLRDGFGVQLLVRELSSPSTLPLLSHTVQLAVTVTTLSIVIGTGAAILVVRTDLPWRRFWTVTLTLPLGVPTFVGAYTWVAASLRYLPESRLLFGLGGATLVLTLTLYPFVFLPVVAALRGLDPAQEEAARSLGDGPVRAFIRVTVPQLRPAVAGGGLIIALHMLAEYGALELLSFKTLTTAIVQRVTVLGSPESARSLALVLVAVAVLFLLVDRLVRGRPQPERLGRGTVRPPAAWRLGRARIPWLLACALLGLLALGVPLYITAVGLIDAFGAGAGRVEWGTLGAATVATARFGLLAAVAATIVGLPVSLMAERYPGRTASLAERSTWVAHALPGVIVALALVYVGVRWLGPVYQTGIMLVIGYVVLFLPLATGSQRIGIRHAAREYDEAARSLGYGPLRTFRRITFPLALPALGAGAMLVLLSAGKDLTTTLLLRPTGTDTLTTALWATTNGEVLNYATAAPYGAALMAIAAIPAWLLARRTL